MTTLGSDTLLLKAAIEFGSDYMYTLKNGGFGPTLCIHAENKEMASKIRTRTPSTWEGLYVLVLYETRSTNPVEKSFYDVKSS
tara:strand:- start:40 stop:288 length:249 start_codon:yes stop_codon:yes gene_type:complete